MANIYIVCPVRKLTEQEKVVILKYVGNLEKSGHEVRCPFRDTDQVDEIGLRIVEDHENDIIWADQVHIWWNRAPEGRYGILPSTGWQNVLCPKNSY